MNKLNALRSSLAALALSATGAAFAAVPTEVTTEISTAKADVMTLGALVFGVMIAVALWKWFRRTV